QRQLEYDFVVAPGANPHAIGLAFQGAQNITLDNAGDLVLHTAGGDVIEHAPVVYQEADGVCESVHGRYVLEDDGQVVFKVGPYDHTRPLIIDPVLAYSTYLGGSAQDGFGGIAVDGSGNAYVTGNTLSTDFPTAGAYQGSLNGGANSTKYDTF